MPFRRRSTSPRHLAGVRRSPGTRPEADFDVEAAFDPDFDFDALFAADDVVDDEAPRVRVSRHRLAVAAAVTAAALPVLFLTSFQANASTPSRVDTAAEHLAPTGPPAILDPLDTTSLPATSYGGTSLTAPPAVVFNADATSTSSSVVVPTTTATTVKLAAPTTTVPAPAPKLIASATPVTTSTTKAPAPTTTTTKPPAPTTTTVKPTTTTAKPTTTTAAPQLPAAKPGDPNAAASWDALAKCESGGNWAANTGNGYYGGLQFSLATWQNLGGTGYPHQASRDAQIAMGKKLYQRSGWGAWPGCARNLGWS